MDYAEKIKKSRLCAKDYFDYEKIKAAGAHFLSCTYAEEGEDICFSYDMEGKKKLEEILDEPKETQYRLLINFAMLEEAYMRYDCPFSMDNLYYDENYLVYIKERDLYEAGKTGDETRFLEIYKSFAGGILSRKYTVEQILSGGISVLRGEKGFQGIYQCGSVEETAEEIRRRKTELEARTKSEKRMVSKSGFFMWKLAAVLALTAAAGLGSYTVYSAGFAIPEQKAVIRGNEEYIAGDYVGCIDALAPLEPEDMDRNTKYILAVSYAKSESLKQEEIASIVDKLSTESNERELDYWICLGRRNLKTAESIAMALSDDKLLIYAYMKEADILESDTSMDGTKKQERISTLEQEIEKLGAKYEAEETEETEETK